METICRVFSKLRHPASPDISVGLKGEKIMAEKVHMCETCGKTTDKFGHLCDPVEVDEAYVCNRVAELPSQLCNPRDIELMKKQDPPTRIT
jgi:hypothetical protein